MSSSHKKVKNLKVCISLYGLETHHRAMERHLPYGMHFLYLIPAPQRSEQCTAGFAIHSTGSVSVCQQLIQRRQRTLSFHNSLKTFFTP